MRGLSAILFLLMIALGGCAEVVDLDSDLGTSQVLIFGRITSGTQGNIIEIARTSAINNVQNPVEGARVAVINGNGGREEYVAIRPGVYQLPDVTTTRAPGGTYALEVTLPGGGVYKTDPVAMPAPPAVDVLDFEATTSIIPLQNNQGTTRRNVIEFYMTTEILNPEEAPLIRWNLIETFLYPEQPQEVDRPDFPPQWCYITNDLEEQQVFLYDGRALKGDKIARRLMTRREANTDFVSEYYLQVVRSSLTPDAYRFWDQINQSANSQGSIFDRPMAPVASNVYNVDDPKERVLGYFEVSQVDTTRIKLNGEQTPFDIRTPCPIIGQVPPECLNCLLLDNSIKVKPYFVD